MSTVDKSSSPLEPESKHSSPREVKRSPQHKQTSTDADPQAPLVMRISAREIDAPRRIDFLIDRLVHGRSTTMHAYGQAMGTAVWISQQVRNHVRGVTQTCKLLELKDQHRESIGIEIVLSRSVSSAKVPDRNSVASKKQIGVRSSEEAKTEAKQHHESDDWEDCDSNADEQKEPTPEKVEIAAQTESSTTAVATTNTEATKEAQPTMEKHAETVKPQRHEQLNKFSSHKRHKLRGVPRKQDPRQEQVMFYPGPRVSQRPPYPHQSPQ